MLLSSLGTRSEVVLQFYEPCVAESPSSSLYAEQAHLSYELVESMLADHHFEQFTKDYE